MSTREHVLGRIRAALSDVPQGEGPDDVTVDRSYRQAGELAADAVADLFAERVTDYRAEVVRTDVAGLAAAVGAVLERLDVRRLGVPAGLPGEWLAAAGGEYGINVMVDDPEDGAGLAVDDLDRLDAVLTGCAVGIAETGTLVLDGAAGGSTSGRRALSLVPDRHVCVVLADQVVETVPEALARLDPRRPTTFVSGPSATSDIELSRVEGVHGPRTLVVVLVG